MSLVSCTEQVW